MSGYIRLQKVIKGYIGLLKVTSGYIWLQKVIKGYIGLLCVN